MGRTLIVTLMNPKAALTTSRELAESRVHVVARRRLTRSVLTTSAGQVQWGEWEERVSQLTFKLKEKSG